ncbi:hypothetical protein HNP84_000295 [Thermocatellispora tengchongensis]|uniref:Pycsar effector protein domain-containing protein n=1 Tax=Thermocatellispora tengchongensis TaxID=1073253 RepID=A0A840P022_9ACTN|nr:hypothetical protein [Thermocatellispora tengchongensis]MBB5130607.1 hypothetical protein [Thermocatellispora tengchongensis]
MRSTKGHAEPDVTREDVAEAAAAVANFQNYVQHAEGKVNVLVVVHAGAVATVASQAGAGGLAEAGPVVAGVGLGLLGLFVLGVLISGYHLLRAIRPELRSPDRPSRYGITGVRQVTGGTPADRVAEAWSLARLLAGIAQRKHAHVARAIPWTGLALVSAVLWTTLNAAPI